MSDHGTHHDSDNSGELKSKTAFRSSFWFVIILVGLFIAALNFMKVMGHSEGHKAKETEEMHSGREHETTAHESAAPLHDSTAHEDHH